MDDKNPYYLDCDAAYLALSEVDRFVICNGCGSANAKFDFVPDTIWGLSIRDACYVHDYDYYSGKTESDKKKADLRFLLNMLTIIAQQSTTYMVIPRAYRAITYYFMVRRLGGPAFWAGKQKPVKD